MDHSNINYQQLLTALFPVAKAAGAAIMEIYEKSEGLEIERKADNSPLTIADRASNTVICEALEQLEPRFPIISEENKAIPYAERKGFNYAWMVDPLDGTKEFIKRNGEFTVNIALIHQQMPVLGVVYVPATKELFYAAKGLGAFQEKDGKTSPLHAPTFSKTDQGLGVVCSRSHLNEATQGFIDELVAPEKVAVGSSLKFLIIAKAQAHLYPRLAPTMEWDTAAAQIVLEEAGGKVYQSENGNPLQYNKENLLNPYFVATGNQVELSS